ncbi:MAG: DUF7544 domain-containing protein, partial [Halohasta sp.]
MSWYAVESVDDAIDATRSFLFPFEFGTWLRLALISLFVGTGGGGLSSVSNTINLPSSMPSETDGSGSAPPPEAPPEQISEILQEPALIGAIVVGLLLLFVGLAVLSVVLRFVFYDALQTGTVRIREPARRRFGQALRLLGFNLLVSVAFGLVILVFAAITVVIGGEFEGTTAAIGAMVLSGGLAVLTLIASIIVGRVTREFVVPVMVITDSGVLDGWRRFWPVLRSNLSQFVVYVVVHFLLLLAISIGQSLLSLIVFGIVGTIGAVVGLAVVFGVFGGLNAAVASTVGLVALGVIALFTLAVGFVLVLPVSIVVLTYVTTYEVSVLAAADGDLQLLADELDGSGDDDGDG